MSTLGFLTSLIVSKPSSQAPSPTNGSQKQPTGQQRKLETTPYEFNDLRFPFSIGTDNKNLHWIKFIPTVQNKSSYNVKKSVENNQEVLSRTDGNRINTGGQLGSGTDQIGGAGTVVGFAAALAALSGGSAFLEGAGRGDPNTVFKTGGAAAGGAIA